MGGAASGGIPAAGPSEAGLRERKRMALRQRLSETATLLFLERGFDAVRVSDVAAACGVSTKTVWNHFPTKQALLFDRGEVLASILRDAAQRPTDVLGCVLSCIHSEIDRLDGTHRADDDSSGREVLQTVKAFTLLCESNPSLRAATADRLEQLIQLAATALAAQTSTSPTAPENQIAASALIGLWRVHLGVLLRYADTRHSLSAVRQVVREEVETAAAVVARIVPGSAATT